MRQTEERIITLKKPGQWPLIQNERKILSFSKLNCLGGKKKPVLCWTNMADTTLSSLGALSSLGCAS